MSKALTTFLAAIFAVVVLVPILSLLSGWIVWLIWNHSVRFTLGLPALGFWQVYFLNWLVGVIGGHFKSSLATSK